MGSCHFAVRQTGKTAAEAFAAARDRAAYDTGHDGYTGTIFEKSSFEMVKVPEGKTPKQTYSSVRDEWDDKEGPAGCIDMGDGSYIFFGEAAE